MGRFVLAGVLAIQMILAPGPGEAATVISIKLPFTGATSQRWDVIQGYNGYSHGTNPGPNPPQTAKPEPVTRYALDLAPSFVPAQDQAILSPVTGTIVAAGFPCQSYGTGLTINIREIAAGSYVYLQLCHLKESKKTLKALIGPVLQAQPLGHIFTGDWDNIPPHVHIHLFSASAQDAVSPPARSSGVALPFSGDYALEDGREGYDLPASTDPRAYTCQAYTSTPIKDPKCGLISSINAPPAHELMPAGLPCCVAPGGTTTGLWYLLVADPANWYSDENWIRIVGATVRISVPAGCGTFDSNTAVSDASGAVVFVYRASDTPGICTWHLTEVGPVFPAVYDWDVKQGLP